jgi:hypothetical protein
LRRELHRLKGWDMPAYFVGKIKPDKMKYSLILLEALSFIEMSLNRKI